MWGFESGDSTVAAVVAVVVGRQVRGRRDGGPAVLRRRWLIEIEIVVAVVRCFGEVVRCFEACIVAVRYVEKRYDVATALAAAFAVSRLLAVSFGFGIVGVQSYRMR